MKFWLCRGWWRWCWGFHLGRKSLHVIVIVGGDIHLMSEGRRSSGDTLEGREGEEDGRRDGKQRWWQCRIRSYCGSNNFWGEATMVLEEELLRWVQWILRRIRLGSLPLLLPCKRVRDIWINCVRITLWILYYIERDL